MDPQADSDEEFIVLSTSDYAESASHTRNVESFIKPFGFLPSLLRGSFKSSGTSEAYTRKYSEAKPGRDAAERLVNNYYSSYHITGGFGGSGGEGHTQGGDGGTGQGPTVYFGQPQERESSAFRTIRRGDVKLVGKEVVVNRLSRGLGVRRIYHAEICGDPGTVTVAMYQGDSAEEAATHYMSDVSWELSTYHDSPSVWIRSATGQLCLDLAQGGPSMSSQFDQWGEIDQHRDILRLENISLDSPDSEDIIISSLSKDQYHKLCFQPSFARRHQFQVSTEHPIGPGVFQMDSHRGTCVRIMEPLQILPDKELGWDNYRNAPDELLPNSWIRYDSSRTCFLELELRLEFWSYKIGKAWLAQANHIFAKLQGVAHAKDYVCINEVGFILRITNKPNIPDGYLFVCPPEDLRTNTEPHANLYRWPACAAYWSLDPSGADRLTTEDAKNLGFPTIHIETVMYGSSWECSIYKGLRRFHEGKGFDPESREVARRLGYPLFEVLSDQVPFPAREAWICKKDDPALCREFGHYL
ncbi:hypothetical protein MSAN_02279300 [Mycena sanguinolenta]|uniref:Uncharacterized protein n=1 Tax=Mycena sanguinolenta TaxID=230812 RepID=A0A8H6XA42_9AGAR|nr:hypothetical protein MSAN_02279300 [Mycena sanguinolenta]